MSQEMNSFDDYFDYIPQAWEELSSETREIEISIPAVMRAVKPVSTILEICSTYKYYEGDYRFEKYVSVVIAEFTQYEDQGCVSVRDIAKLVTFSKYSIWYLEDIRDTLGGVQKMIEQFKILLSIFANFDIKTELLAEISCKLKK